MSDRDQPCRFKYNARNLRHSSPGAGRKSAVSIPLFYAAMRVTLIAQRSVISSISSVGSLNSLPDVSQSSLLIALGQPAVRRKAKRAVSHVDHISPLVV